MKLLTKAILKQFEKAGDQSEEPNPLIVCKFFNPYGAQTWYCSEYFVEEQIFYGFVVGVDFPEWGTTSLDDIKNTRVGPFGMRIERDRHFNPTRFYDLPEIVKGRDCLKNDLTMWTAEKIKAEARFNMGPAEKKPEPIKLKFGGFINNPQ